MAQAEFQSTALHPTEPPVLFALNLEEELFEGAPPLPRVDTGDAFDTMLHFWLTGETANDLPELGDELAHSISQRAASQQSVCSQDLSTVQQQHNQLVSSAAVASTAADAPPKCITNGRSSQPAEYPPAVQYSSSGPGFNGAQTLAGVPSSSQPQQQAYAQVQAADVSLPGTHSSFAEHERPQIVSPPASSGTKLGPQPASSGVSHQSSEHESLAAPDTKPPSFPVIQALEVSAAKSAWPKRRRGPQSEQALEKERVRNRRAQKRFREREKERQEARQSALANLEAQLAELSKEKAALELRNAALESAAQLKQEQRTYDADPAPWDPQLYMEVTVGEAHDLQPQVTLPGMGQALSKDEVIKMGFREHARLYKGYVDAMRQQLEAGPGSETETQLVKLCQELCLVNLALAVAEPSKFAAFQTSRLDAQLASPQAVQVPAAVWRRCLEAVGLSDAQKRALLFERRQYLGRLRPLLKQRCQLQEIVNGTLMASNAGNEVARAKALEAVEELRENLKQEQVMLVQTMCATFQQHFAPHQTAANIVAAFPYHPNVPMLVDIIASQVPGEASTAELLGANSVPLQ